MLRMTLILCVGMYAALMIAGVDRGQLRPGLAEAAAKAAREGSSVPDVRTIFDKAAQIDDIKSIKGADLEVTKRNDKIVVSYQYSREIALAGPAYLVYRFNEQTK